MNQELYVSGDDTFVRGADSYSQPTNIEPGAYFSAENTIARGGVLQTRPGSKSLLEVPSGNLQGITFFTPSSGTPTLVFVVDGIPYYSSYPFTEYNQIPGIKLGKYSRYVAWASCQQTTDIDGTGRLIVLDEPKAILMFADGYSRTAWWDGSSGGQLDPAANQTPVGLWMTWSNNRLWISNGIKVYASDWGNPKSFDEAQYLNEGRAFYLPEPCTGMAETSDEQGLLVFTRQTATYIKSGIQDRTQWLSTPQFMDTILTGLGCVSPRSIVRQYGYLWWYSANGLVNQDDVERFYITSNLTLKDNEMFASKRELADDLTGIAGGCFENFLFHAVPHASYKNTRIHMLDQAPFDQEERAWPSYWTGWNPVEFATGTIGSQKRVFTISYDNDGVNRIWELFRPEKTDNGIPITSSFVSRTHLFDNRDYKQFRFIEVELCNLSGNVAVCAGIKGIRGAFQKALEKDITATNGQVYYASDYGYNANTLYGSRLQTRIIRSIDSSAASECNSKPVESPISGLIDKGFQVSIAWSGIAGISAYRVFAQSYPNKYQGDCEVDEETSRILSPIGCGSESEFSGPQEPFPRYFAKCIFSQTSSGESASKVVVSQSFINQKDANRKAVATAKWYVSNQLGIS